MIFFVTIQDKTLYGESDIALAVVEAPDEDEALRAARPTIEALADRGRGRCVPHARRLEVGKFYRLGAVVRLPRDPDLLSSGPEAGLDLHKEPLPDLPCPRCRCSDTVPLRNYGRPMAGDAEGTSRWQCLECKRQFDGPKVRR